MREPRCQVCAGPLSAPLLDLGHLPLCNRLVRSLDEPVTIYPLAVHRCAACDLVQLGHVLPTEALFGDDFTYLTGSSPGAVRYFGELAKKLFYRFRLNPGDLVVDVGSGDGTFLKGFRKQGAKVLGIEGARKPAAAAIQDGILTTTQFLGHEMTVQAWLSPFPALVTAMNVLAHCSDVDGFMQGLLALMGDETILVVQNHWLMKLLDEGAFDTIYHEHLRYFTLGSIERLLNRYGLFVLDAERADYYGGSLLVYASKKPAPKERPRVESILADEADYDWVGAWPSLADRCVDNRYALLQMLAMCRDRGELVIGIGAPMKATTLLNYHGIGRDLIGCVTETNPLKIGLRIPGVGIKIVEEHEADIESADRALILAWNWAEPIKKKYREMGFRGKFILPHPEVRAVE